ncbi:MAG: hypothetical protein ACKO2G_14590 [Verrucomicrobiales bacterium]
MKKTWCHGPLDRTGEPMRLFVGAPVSCCTDTATEVHYLLRLGSDEVSARILDTLSFRINRAIQSSLIGIEPAMAALLPFAMARHWDLVAEASAATGFAEVLEEYALISDAWLEDWRKPRIEMHTESEPQILPQGRGEAAFFSGGVDSFYTLVARQGQLADVVFLTGFDIEPVMTAHSRLADKAIHAAARMFGVGVVHVETNVRALRHYALDWVYMGGAVLAGTALLLRGLYQRVHVASDSTWKGCLPAHEHPVMHNLWRLPGFRMRCDMVSIPRVERVRLLGMAMPGALAHLRVCWDMLPFHLNCGKCEKCQRTLAALEVFGFRQQAAPAFESSDLDWEMISSLRPDSMRRPYWQEITDAARQLGRRDISDPLDEMLKASEVKEVLELLEPLRKELIGTTAWKKKDPRIRDRFFDALFQLDPGWFWQKLRRHRDEWRHPLKAQLRSLGHAGWAELARLRLRRFFNRPDSNEG